MTRKVYVLNGANLNMLGKRQPEIYGTTTLADIERECVRVADELGLELFFAQSNAEYQMIDWLQEAFEENALVVINPAGFSFGSVPLLDALLLQQRPVIEVHITNIHARDEAHRHSLQSQATTAVIAGAGPFGYELALRAVDRLGSAA